MSCGLVGLTAMVASAPVPGNGLMLILGPTLTLTSSMVRASKGSRESCIRHGGGGSGDGRPAFAAIEPRPIDVNAARPRNPAIRPKGSEFTDTTFLSENVNRSC